VFTFTEYDSWTQVPAHLRTGSQLADLDLPRIPGGDPVARVYDRGPHGRKGAFDLYDARTSLPSTATARHLEASRARQSTDPRLCADCGAHTGSPATNHHDDTTDQWVRLCWTCLYIRRLRQTQSHLAAARARAADLAATLLDQDTAAVVHVAPIAPPPGENGRPKKPIAAHVSAVTPTGTRLADITVRLNASRNPIIPTDAVALTDAAPILRELTAGRTIVEWTNGALRPLADHLLPRGHDLRPDVIALDRHVTNWRGEIDPHTRQPIIPLDPGRADLMGLLLRRIAADHTGQITT
jgi:hypothetical protein